MNGTDQTRAAALQMAATLRAIHREVLRAPSRDALLSGACRVAVASGGLRLAWVGWLKDDAILPVARAGHDDGYVDGVAASLSGQRSAGPTGRSLLRDEPAYTDDFSTDARMAPWREAALARGFASSAALPLHLRGQVVGSLNIYSGVKGFFHGDARAGLEELADDISFTLDRLEDAVERERAQQDYRALFEQAADGIFLANEQGRYLDVNEAGVRLLGYAPEELRALNMSDLLPPADLTATPLRLTEVRTRVTTFHHRRLKRKDGTLAEVEIAGTRLSDGRVQGIVRDVTERNRLMAELVHSDRLASVGRLAAGIAHEVNNPLAYVLLNLSMLRRHLEAPAEAPSAPPTELVREAIEGTERVAEIVRDLRTMARTNEEAPGPVDLKVVVEAALRIAGHQVRRCARVVLDLKPTPAVHATGGQLEQVVINLLVNATQAIEPGAPSANRISVRVFPQAGVGVLEVADTGSGIPPEVQSRLFDPFFTTRPRGEGTGLGLAISHGLITSFGGRLTFSTEPGKGTTFRVEVPLSARPMPAAAAARVVPEVTLAGLKVLVVDDEPGIRDALARLLPGCSVVTAEDVPTALARLQEGPFDVVLSDVLMPGATGEVLLGAVRRDHPHLASRVIFMTGAAMDEAVQAFLATLGTPVLEKPFDSVALERAVRQVLAQDT